MLKQYHCIKVCLIPTLFINNTFNLLLLILWQMSKLVNCVVKHFFFAVLCYMFSLFHLCYRDTSIKLFGLVFFFFCSISQTRSVL